MAFLRTEEGGYDPSMNPRKALVATDFGTRLAQAKSGEAKALEVVLDRLAEKLRPELTRLAGTKLKSKLRPSDLLQEAFLEVVRRLPRFEGENEEQLVGWARVILLNTVRKQARDLGATKRKAPDRPSQLAVLARSLHKPSPTPSSLAIDAEKVGALETAIAELREEHQLVIEAILLDERPVEEVALELGRTVPATRMLLSRARAALALSLDDIRRRG